MVQFKGKDFALSPGWRLELARGGSQDDIAVEGLKEGLASRFHLFLGSGAGRGHQGGVIRIETSPGSVKIGDATDRNRASLGGQAYRLDLGPEAINRFLKSAGEAAARHDSARAVAALDAALDVVEELRAERNASLRDATDTWYKTWYPRVLEANGRRFLHELDDVKDHVPDRTVDMTYLVYRQLILPFGEWAERVRAVRNTYAGRNGLPERERKIDWKDTAPAVSREQVSDEEE